MDVFTLKLQKKYELLMDEDYKGRDEKTEVNKSNDDQQSTLKILQDNDLFLTIRGKY